MSNYVGFKGFTKPASVSSDLVEKKLDRMQHSNLYVYYTGGKYRFRKGSGRSGALQTITEIQKPVPVAELIRRAATAFGDKGYSPDMVRSGLFLHRGSKPAVYLALEKRDDGSFVAATDYPYPDGFDKPLKEGDVVLPAGIRTVKAKAIAAPKKGKATKKLAAPKK